MLKLKNITKDYLSSENDKVNALKNINVNFSDTGLVVICGVSGSGKTTLLNILGGIDKPDSGLLEFNHKTIFNAKTDYRDTYLKNQISFVFQEYNLLEEFTVEDNLKLSCANITDQEVSNVLNKVGLSGYEKRFPNQLSSGQRQRVSICRGIIKKSSIILADEPTGALDSNTGVEIMELLKTISNDRLVIIVSHNIVLSRQYADRLIEIVDGEIVDDKNLMNEETKNSHFNDSNLIEFKPFRSFMKLAFNSLFRHKTRLLFTLLLAVISLTSFALISSFSMYDNAKNTMLSFERSEISIITLENWKRHLDDSGVYVTYSNGFTEEELLWYDNRSQTGVIPIYDTMDISFKEVLFNDNNHVMLEYYNNANVNGIAIYNNDFFSSVGYSLIAGKEPDVNNNFTEILITKHMYELLKETDLFLNQVKHVVESYEDVLNLELDLSGVQMKIVGIIDTKFNDTYFQRIYDIQNDSSIESIIVSSALKESNEYLLHNTLFVHSSYMSDYNSTTIELQDKIVFDFDNRYQYDDINDSNGANVISSSFTGINNIVWINDEKTELINGEMILPLSSLSNYVDQDGIGYFSELVNDEVNQLIHQHVLDNFDNLKIQYEGMFFPFVTYYEYEQYIKSNPINEYEEDITLANFTHDANESIFREKFLPLFEENVCKYTYYFRTESFECNVVGYYDDSQMIDADLKGLVLSVETFKNIVSKDSNIINFIAVPISETNGLIEDLVEEHFTSDRTTNWIEVNNEITSTLDYIDGVVSSSSKVAFLVSGVVLSFSVVLLINTIYQIMNERQKDIGILMTMGYSKSHINKIFLIESLSVGFATLLITYINLLVIDLLISSLTNSITGDLIVLININFIQYMMLFAITIGIAYITFVMSSIKLKSMNPIDILKTI